MSSYLVEFLRNVQEVLPTQVQEFSSVLMTYYAIPDRNRTNDIVIELMKKMWNKCRAGNENLLGSFNNLLPTNFRQG